MRGFNYSHSNVRLVRVRCLDHWPRIRGVMYSLNTEDAWLARDNDDDVIMARVRVISPDRFGHNRNAWVQ